MKAVAKDVPSPELSGRLASTKKVAKIELKALTAKVNEGSSLSLLTIVMVAALSPELAQVRVKETVKVVSIPLATVLLSGSLILKLGLLMITSVIFSGKLPMFLMVKVLVTSVFLKSVIPKFLPSLASKEIAPVTMSILFPSTTISWGESS